GGSFGGKPVRVEGTRQVFKYELGTQANRPDWVSLSRRQLPTLMTCGAQPLVDISGPETMLPDGAEGRYRYCVAAKPGACPAGSKTGQLYLNCAYLETLGCTAKQGTLDTCAGNFGMYVGGVAQVGFSADDKTGALGRRLGSALNRYRLFDQYWNVKPLPDA